MCYTEFLTESHCMLTTVLVSPCTTIGTDETQGEVPTRSAVYV